MKRKSFTLIEVMVIVAIIVILAIIIPAIWNARPSAERNPQQIVAGHVTLTTIEYDGHKFIVGTKDHNSAALAIVHSPACPCQPKAERF